MTAAEITTTGAPAFDLAGLLARFPDAGGECPAPALPRMPVYLSWGMGVESTAILVRWLLDPSSRDFDLWQLTVIVAQTGDEWNDTKELSELYLFPLLRRFGVRVVQVARAGHLEEDGIEVLDDTREPWTLHTDGAYRLSDELAMAGTVPTFGGVHKCALKFKAFVIERWFETEPAGPFRQAFGYNSEETSRIEKSEYHTARRVAFGFNAEETGRIERAGEYDGMKRESFYPLMVWLWARPACVEYLFLVFGVEWPKSACTFCPFNALKAEAVERLRRNPEETAKALLVEYRALCMNPRATLYSGRSLMSVVEREGMTAALEAFRRLLARSPWGYYRVRRIYSAKGKADRCVERFATGTREEMERRQYQDWKTWDMKPSTQHGIRYYYEVEREPDTYPAREEFYVVAPADVATKARYGLPWFEGKWDGNGQKTLFG